MTPSHIKTVKFEIAATEDELTKFIQENEESSDEVMQLIIEQMENVLKETE